MCCLLLTFWVGALLIVQPAVFNINWYTFLECVKSRGIDVPSVSNHWVALSDLLASGGLQPGHKWRCRQGSKSKIVWSSNYSINSAGKTTSLLLSSPLSLLAVYTTVSLTPHWLTIYKQPGGVPTTVWRNECKNYATWWTICDNRQRRR